MSQFHNPYHFVPVTNHFPGAAGLHEFRTGQSAHWTHDRFVRDTHSGRIVCRLVTVSPTFIGALQQKAAGVHSTTRINGYALGERPAIPGSSLRGLISTTAEAASNSALRVLEAEWERAEGRFGAKTKGEACKSFVGISPNLLPFGKHPKKELLTLAELLFGFVEERDNASQAQDQALAFASRVRFSTALPEASAQFSQTPVVLKILSNPKPPRASFYFEPSPGAAGAISTKLPSNNDRPKGRKFYLSHNKECPADKLRSDFETADPADASNQKVEIRPLVEGSEFWFHLDFDNLTETELQLLCYALVPNADYRHRIGLGKPLGLGLVKIDMMGLFLVDRAQRYAGASAADWRTENRYHEVLHGEGFGVQWPTQYEREAATPATSAAAPDTLAKSFRDWAVAQHSDFVTILDALELLGNHSLVRLPVHYPQVDGAGLERNLYQWFSAGPNQYLPGLRNATRLPALDRGALGRSVGGGGGRPAPQPVRPCGPQPGNEYTFTALDPDAEGRVVFNSTIEGKTWSAVLAISKWDRPKWRMRFPQGWTGKLTVQGVQKGRLELKPPIP